MKKKVFIDLNGIVFEPIDTKFSEIARQDFWTSQGNGGNNGI